MLKELFSEFIDIYPGEKNSVKNSADKNYGHLRSTKIMTEELPALLQQMSGLPATQYLFKGSVGKGNMTEVPNLCILDQAITHSPERGYYIVYLFDPEMTKFYLTLLIGWTQFEKYYDYPQQGRKAILKLQQALRNQYDTLTSFSSSELGLIAERTRTRGYIYGTIFHKVYYIDEMPSDQMLLNDLHQMTNLYQTMKEEVGTDILHKVMPTEADFQLAIQTATPAQLSDGPISRSSKIPRAPTKWQRDPSISSEALRRAQYRCEVDSTHTTFISKKNKHQFVEAHHFLPMAMQDNFPYSIDVPENIIALCPNCHRAFHHGENDYKKELINLFYGERILGLQRRGIDISEDALLKIYLKLDDVIE
ncbi:DUF3578 domain-containing protein [Chitinophaga oryzae]|uniref:DUF3578 domain-containing protein n=1 Tax=Chitinophaga oryzae TaxID=2725414 RepID=A0AAE6ZL01_9BACT|nr:DUF3578 domain-containing protein [Chitinophaga oryzae]QJB34619.1 DUF3578 domain-containing protein [Chitinophaga oryzae]QJB41139.1 DUF3578 domain-containing protein [Chitinophaga oryzae]